MGYSRARRGWGAHRARSLGALLASPMSGLERWLLVVSGGLVLLALVLPIWEVYLGSQQYPEGIRLFIHARTLTGRLQSINILNHYIGMKPLTVEGFSEFVWLSPAIAAVAAVMLAAAAVGRRWAMLVGWGVLWAFDLVMLGDLYRWMYDWGNHLDPRAPMTIAPFTPPVLGFKHVANFTIYSFPSWGGLAIVLASGLGVGALWLAWRSAR